MENIYNWKSFLVEIMHLGLSDIQYLSILDDMPEEFTIREFMIANRKEVIEMVMTDGKLQKLQKHLKKARKEEKHIGEQEL